MIPRTFKIGGTSGSTDYLCDGMGEHRFWPVRPELAHGPLTIEDAAVVERLVGLLSAETCDGLHDAGVPDLYLFPDGRRSDEEDLSEPDEDDRTEPEEID